MGKQLEKAWKHSFSVFIIPPPSSVLPPPPPLQSVFCLFFLLRSGLYASPHRPSCIFYSPFLCICCTSDVDVQTKCSHTNTTQVPCEMWGTWHKVLRPHWYVDVAPGVKEQNWLPWKLHAIKLLSFSPRSGVYVTICKYSANEVTVNLEGRENFVIPIITAALDKLVLLGVLSCLRIPGQAALTPR